ncbi:uncharacterized protein CIMG_05568 [Coccidioides immitis RS]|uniref:uncharacterized protein n=1 Tax=Coccidioides immitis (strain RS) TaxID=246410 RepID=UPI00027D2757|nr:uncharacterized protein CIMG_05568 [Coccidioides immitis RS]EAS34544.3 hypothetical protein CIMG_05568 [Coccidioides immitis RS]
MEEAAALKARLQQCQSETEPEKTEVATALEAGLQARIIEWDSELCLGALSYLQRRLIRRELTVGAKETALTIWANRVTLLDMDYTMALAKLPYCGGSYIRFSRQRAQSRVYF